MGETLEALHRLQALERQLAEIRREREAKAHRVEYHKRQIQKAEANLKESQIAIRGRQAHLDAAQLEMNAYEDLINKYRQALNTAKTNKEYAAILTSMNTAKADNSKLETHILQEMDAIQGMKAEAAAIAENREKLAADLARSEAVLHEHDDQWRPARENLEAERDACADQIPPAALSIFNRVAHHHDGEALVPVVRLHPKKEEFICSGCNMKVTLEIINSLHTRDEIQVCAVCGRILHLEAPKPKPSRKQRSVT